MSDLPVSKMLELFEQVPDLVEAAAVNAIGIDLGTTNSVVGCVMGGRVQVLADPESNHLHPSVVSFMPEDEVAVGMSAHKRRTQDPVNTIYSAKRFIGQLFDAPAVKRMRQRVPYKVVEGPSKELNVRTDYGDYSIVDISGRVLAYLRSLAERHMGVVVTHCVITVPASFSDSQREATRRAAASADLEVLRIINEPTAAALAYGSYRSLRDRVAVFDFGGGTFDLTLLELRDDVFEVLATGGDHFLGGDDFDMVVAEWLATQFKAAHGVDLTGDARAWASLVLRAQRLKHELSTKEEAAGTIEHTGKKGRPSSMDYRLTRSAFEEMIEPIVERTLAICDLVLSDASIGPTGVGEVVTVGGSTFVPLVRRRIAEHFGRPPLSSIHPMEVVAAGAAVQAQRLSSPQGSGKASTAMLMDVTSHALGVVTAGGYVEKLIAKNSPMPSEGTRTFSTARDGQERVTLQVCQGQSRRFEDNIPVGELVLDGLEPRPRGDVEIEVSFVIDADGILQVSARDAKTGKEERSTLRILGLKS